MWTKHQFRTGRRDSALVGNSQRHIVLLLVGVLGWSTHVVAQSQPMIQQNNGPATYGSTGSPAATPPVGVGAGPVWGGPQRSIPAMNTAASTEVPATQVQLNQIESARAEYELIQALPKAELDLEVIERRSQLIVTRAPIVRAAISDPSVMDIMQYSPKEISIIGLIRGTTTLTLWFEGRPEPLIYNVKVIRDPNWESQRKIDYGRLERKLAQLFPNSKVYLIPMSFKIIVRGQARDQEEAAHILNVIQGEIINQEGSLFGPQFGYGGYGGVGAGYGGAGYFDQVGGGNGFGAFGANNLLSRFIVNDLRVPGEFQIALKWRIAQLNRTMAQNAGININVLFQNGRHLLQSTMSGANGNLAGAFENNEIQIFLNWLAANGTAKILTEPNVTVLSGRQARFLAGGEFAVPTIIGIAGAQGQSTSFRGVGTSVLVTPTVIDRDLIRLQTVAEYSEINGNNTVGGIPGTNTRRIETTVELREGQTFALAGLLSHQTNVEVNRVPWLGDIPKIGPLLFSAKKATLDETELLILVTPEIVRPMDPHEVPPVPGFEVTWPSAHEFFCHNVVEGAPDTGYYQLPPYGSGAIGTNVGYQHFNPGPANSMYSPQPTNPYGNGSGPAGGAGFSAPQGVPGVPGVPPSGPTTGPGMGPNMGPGTGPGTGPNVGPGTRPGPGMAPPPGGMGPNNFQNNFSSPTPIPDPAMGARRGPNGAPQFSQQAPAGNRREQAGWGQPSNPQTITPTNYTVPSQGRRPAATTNGRYGK